MHSAGHPLVIHGWLATVHITAHEGAGKAALICYAFAAIQVLLQGHSGTYAECVSQLLVQLYHAVQMEAVQLSGFWKAGGQQSVGPGDRLAAQNHSWVAVKVNGRWRLLDPVYAILRCAGCLLSPALQSLGNLSSIRSCGQSSLTPGNRRWTSLGLPLSGHLYLNQWFCCSCRPLCYILWPVPGCRQGQLPFYLPPEAFIYTHLPFEAYWQLLPNPVSRDQWWNMPELALPFFAVGGQLQDDQLRSCTLLPAVR